jgi:tetratricopeptide (TPR) repeat protein
MAEALIGRLDGIGPIDPRSVGLVHQARAIRLVAQGDYSGWIDQYRAAVARFEEVGDLRSACQQIANLAYGLIVVGAYGEAERELRRLIQTAERLNLTIAAVHARQNLGLALGYLGALDEARAVEAETIGAYEKQGVRRMQGLSCAYLAWLDALAGSLDRAEEEARAAVDVLAAIPACLATALGVLAMVLVQRGAPEALDAAERGIAILHELGSIDDGEAWLRLAWADALAAAGRADDARTAILEARDYVLRVAGKIGDEARRESFLCRVPENARILALAGPLPGGAGG